MPPKGQPNDSQSTYILQLKLFKALSVVLAILLLTGAGYYVYRTREIQPVAITVNGVQVAVASNMAVATKALVAVRHNRLGDTFDASSKPLFVEHVQLVRIPEAQATAIDTDDTIYSKVSAQVHITAIAGAIVVNKAVVVGLPSVDMANQTLDALKQHYASMPPNDPISGDPVFREKVTVVRKRIPATLTRPTVDEAVEFIVTPPPAKTYTVKNHDTGWLIARRFHMDFAKFIASNADINVNKLRIGDEVNVSVTTPPITVLVTKRSDTVEAIRKGVSSDRAGKRRLSVETTYANGHPFGDPVTLDVTTLQRATPTATVM